MNLKFNYYYVDSEELTIDRVAIVEKIDYEQWLVMTKQRHRFYSESQNRFRSYKKAKVFLMEGIIAFTEEITKRQIAINKALHLHFQEDK